MMSIRGAAEAVLPLPAQSWLKRAIYRHNCRLSPLQYRSALKRWYWLFNLTRDTLVPWGL